MSASEARAEDGPPCTLCGSVTFIPLFTVQRWGVPLPIARCARCRLVRMNPLPDDAALAALYDAAYYDGTADYHFFDERRHEQIMRVVWRERLRKLAALAPARTLLDVGCSFGGLVQTAQAQGWCAWGPDVSRYAVEQGRAAGVSNLVVGHVDSAGFAAGTFGAINMSEVIEHLRDPAAVVRACNHVSRPGAVLAITTSNIDGLRARLSGARWHYFMPGHLHYFSRTTLSYLLDACGYRVATIVASGNDISLAAELRDYWKWNIPAPKKYWFALTLPARRAVRDLSLGRFQVSSGMTVYAVKARQL